MIIYNHNISDYLYISFTFSKILLRLRRVSVRRCCQPIAVGTVVGQYIRGFSTVRNTGAQHMVQMRHPGRRVLRSNRVHAVSTGYACYCFKLVKIVWNIVSRVLVVLQKYTCDCVVVTIARCRYWPKHYNPQHLYSSLPVDRRRTVNFQLSTHVLRACNVKYL